MTLSQLPEKQPNLLSDIFLREETCVLGLPLDTVSESGALESISNSIQESKRCFLSTPNLNFAISALKDKSFFDSICLSDLSVADGMPLVMVSKLIAEPIPERIAGSSLFERLTTSNSKKPISIFFFGGDDGVAETAKERMGFEIDKTHCVGALNPGRGSVEDMSQTNIIDLINNANPDFLVVSLGAKKGQSWILKNKERLNARVISHLGAVVNFVAGNITRAPIFWQKTGLEWIWRIFQEPALFKRYLNDGGQFLYLVSTKVIPLALYSRTLKRRTKGEECLARFEHKDLQTLYITGAATGKTIVDLRNILANDLVLTKDLIVNLNGLVFADGVFFALLLRIQTQLSESDKKLNLIAVPTRIHRLAKLHLVASRININ